jgi:hypothetical protein
MRKIDERLSTEGTNQAEIGSAFKPILERKRPDCQGGAGEGATLRGYIVKLVLGFLTTDCDKVAPLSAS